jgi:hypothetical protein
LGLLGYRGGAERLTTVSCLISLPRLWRFTRTVRSTPANPQDVERTLHIYAAIPALAGLLGLGTLGAEFLGAQDLELSSGPSSRSRSKTRAGTSFSTRPTSFGLGTSTPTAPRNSSGALISKTVRAARGTRRIGPEREDPRTGSSNHSTFLRWGQGRSSGGASKSTQSPPGRLTSVREGP